MSTLSKLNSLLLILKINITSFSFLLSISIFFKIFISNEGNKLYLQSNINGSGMLLSSCI